MTYEEFKEEFQEKMIDYLPENYRQLQIIMEEKTDTFKGKYDIAGFSDQKNLDIKFPELDIKGIYNSIKDLLDKKGIVYVFGELSAELEMIIDKAYRDACIQSEQTEHLMDNIEKKHMIYDLRCEQVEDTLNSFDIMDNMAKQESSNLLIVPFQGQLVVVPEKEVQDAGGTIDEFVTEAEIFMMADGDSYGKNVFLYDRETRNLSAIESKSMVKTL